MRPLQSSYALFWAGQCLAQASLRAGRWSTISSSDCKFCLCVCVFLVFVHELCEHLFERGANLCIIVEAIVVIVSTPSLPNQVFNDEDIHIDDKRKNEEWLEKDM